MNPKMKKAIERWVLQRELVRARHISKKFGITGQMAGILLLDIERRGLIKRIDPTKSRLQYAVL